MNDGAESARRPLRRIGRYPIHAHLGRGGMGIVYLAEDPRLGRRIAIKMLPGEFASEPARRSRFEREAKLLATLNHPNIAIIHSLEDADGRDFITLELIAGQDLGARIARGPLGIPETISIARQLFSALEAAHERGVVHRDLKPTNIMITPTGLVKVLDFGLAKAFRSEAKPDPTRGESTITGEQALVGTAGYMSPEQVEGRGADHRADIWASGCVLYECLVGENPFQGDNELQRLTAPLTQDPDWSRLPAETPVWLHEILIGCLTRNVDARLGAASELLRRIEEGTGQGTPVTTPLPPPLEAARDTPNNLPLRLTSFVGRERVTDEVRRLLTQNRLLTLMGSGGCGKSRLALRVGELSLESSPGGVWIVELAALRDPGLVPQTTAYALGFHEERERSFVELLIDVLRERTAILILDNCEHLLDPCAVLAENLLGACAHLRLLVTSREALGIEGEATYRVPSLELPVGDAPTPEAIAEAEAVRLFVDRAKTIRHDFTLTPSSAAAIVEICCRLDGIPLAIELAAARIQVMDVEEVKQRLDQRFRLLRSTGRGHLQRHQTLHALVEWSYEQLTTEEQAVFRRLSVFAGGCTLASAEAVCSGGEIDGSEVFDLFTRLVGKSLVEQEREKGTKREQTRYRMLESVLAFAMERLAESGEEGETRRRHLEYFVSLTGEASRHLAGQDQSTWLSRLAAEHDNLRAAMAKSSRRATDAGPRLAVSLGQFWEVRGFWGEGREFCERLLAPREVPLDPSSRCRIIAIAGRLAVLQGDYERARSLYGEGLDLARSTGDQIATAQILNSLGEAEKDQGNLAQAGEIFEEALQVSRGLEEAPGTARALCNLGLVAHARGEFEAARGFLEKSLAIDRESGDSRRIAISLNGLGNVAIWQADHDRARALHEESLAIKRELGDRRGIYSSLQNLGIVAGNLGEYDRSNGLFEEGLRISRELGDRRGISRALNNLGIVALRLGDLDKARTHFEHSMEIDRERGDKRGVFSSLENLGIVTREQGDFEAAHRLLEEGLALARELGDRSGIAYSINRLGLVAHARGNHVRARELYEECLAMQTEERDSGLVAASLEGLGAIAVSEADFDLARSLYERSLAVSREMRDRSSTARTLNRLGHVFHALGDHARARSLHEESLGISRELGEKGSIAVSLAGLGASTYHEGDGVQAVRLYGAARALAESIRFSLDSLVCREMETHLSRLRMELGEDVFSRESSAGATASLDEIASSGHQVGEEPPAER